MCHIQYTIRDYIRTQGIREIRRIREIRQRETLADSIAVVRDKIQVIIKNIDSIHESFDKMTTDAGIVPIAFFKLTKEENHTVMVQQLSLGIAEHFNRHVQRFS